MHVGSLWIVAVYCAASAVWSVSRSLCGVECVQASGSLFIVCSHIVIPRTYHRAYCVHLSFLQPVSAANAESCSMICCLLVFAHPAGSCRCCVCVS